MEKDFDIQKLVWTKRFMNAAILQGAIIVGFTLFLIFGQISLIKPEVSRIIAAGGPGTWFTFGYIMYILIGVIGVAVSALFYLYLERVIKRQYRDSTITRFAAWIHLILMNVGNTAAMSMLMFVGYIGGASMLPVSVGGRGFTAGQAHEILSPFVEPIGASILVLIIGVIIGGMGFLLVQRKKN